MDTKSLRVEVKDADKGEVKAVFSTFGQVDSDGDWTDPKAFTDGAKVKISAYGHASWGGALPVGKGEIRVTDEHAEMHGEFFLHTQAGKDTFEVVKAMGELQEWSYGFDVEEADYAERDGRQVRVLKGIRVFEVSPVLRGAGVNTRTLAVKDAPSAPQSPRKRALASHDTPVVSRAWDAAAVRRGIAEDARPSELRSVFAWVDPDGDPETLGSYKFPHHHGVNGPANVRACLAGIAVLNGARGGSAIPDADRKGVYNHLASHLRDADREPPQLRTSDGDVKQHSNLRFADEAAFVLAGVDGFIERAAEVMALRARKGKGISTGAAEYIAWIDDSLRRMKALLEHPTEDDDEPSPEEIASVFAASVARLQNV